MLESSESAGPLAGATAIPSGSSVAEALEVALRHHRAHELQPAEAIYRRILSENPTHGDALHFLGVAAYQNGGLENASGLLARAIAANPGVAAYHYHFGLVLAALGKPEEAIASYGQALKLAPDLAEVHNGFGNALKDLGRLEEAAERYRLAVRLKPGLAQGYSNLGNVLELLGERLEAAHCYQRALALDSNDADAHWNSALLKLLTGDFEQGWDEYEWRRKTKWAVKHRYRGPEWSGEPLAGKTILLYAEQGLGDTIQFIRYAGLVKARGATVVVQCQRPLLGILAGSPGVDRLVAEDEPPPPFDWHAALLSLPRIFRTTLANVPCMTRYLVPSPALAVQWRQRLAGLGGFKIGIGWQGNARYSKDRYRSVPLRHFGALARVPGVRLIALQKGLGAKQLCEMPPEFPIVDFSRELDEASGPFMDTAAIVESLDLVITSDTALAHLAGALGACVWVALSFAPDWRWLLERGDSPWYPTMRLFRQRSLGDWGTVFEEIRAALENVSARTRSAPSR
jgi:Flp pilus assembly protein TadD